MNIRFIPVYRKGDWFYPMRAQQGRNTFETKEACDNWQKAVLFNNLPAVLLQTYGTTEFKSLAVECYMGHNDPMGCIFSATCKHNEMKANDDPVFAWKCATCGYIYA